MPLFGLRTRPSTARITGLHQTNIEQDETGALADTITTAGMAGPASVAFRIMKPVSWIGGQLLWVLEPLLGTLGMRRTNNVFSLPGLATLLEREDSIDNLINRLEGSPGERRT